MNGILRDIAYLRTGCSFGEIKVTLGELGTKKKCTEKTGKVICDLKKEGIFKDYPNGDLHLTIFEKETIKPHVSFYPDKKVNSIVYHYGTDEIHPKIGYWGTGSDESIKKELNSLFDTILNNQLISVKYITQNKENIELPIDKTPTKVHIGFYPGSNLALNNTEALLLNRTRSRISSGRKPLDPVKRLDF
jgi:hypothetical protein